MPVFYPFQGFQDVSEGEDRIRQKQSSEGN